MALISCPECGREVSTRAAACPHCGCPLDEAVIQEAAQLRYSPPLKRIPATTAAAADAAQVPESAETETVDDAPEDEAADEIIDEIEDEADGELVDETDEETSGEYYDDDSTDNFSESKVRQTIASFSDYIREKAEPVLSKLKKWFDEADRKTVITIFAACGACIALLIIMFSSCIFFHHYSRATCTAPKTCRVCGQTNGVPLGHSYVRKLAKSATCTREGLYKYSCENCSYAYHELIPRLPHTPTDATCTSASICSKCKKELAPALGHTIEEYTEVPATCTETGSRSGVCTVCGETATETIPMLEHKAGDWAVIKEATFSESGERVKKCTSCGKELEHESYSLSSDEKTKYLKNHSKTYSYDEIFRYPDKYSGEYAKFKGEVVQVMDAGLATVLRVNVTKGKYYWNDTVYVVYYDTEVNGAKILEDDIIWMYGILDGTETYETVIGGTVTIPRMKCYHIEFA